MKVAIFTSSLLNELIILVVKGKCKSVEDVNDYYKWFGKKTGRDVRHFEVTLCDTGTRLGLVKDEEDIAYWFYNQDKHLKLISSCRNRGLQ